MFEGTTIERRTASTISRRPDIFRRSSNSRSSREWLISSDVFTSMAFLASLFANRHAQTCSPTASGSLNQLRDNVFPVIRVYSPFDV